MKILVACYKNIGAYAGDVRHVIEIVKGLKKLGHNVQLCAPLMKRYDADNELNIKYIPTVNCPFLRYLSYSLLSPFYLIAFFLKFRPDAVLLFEIHFDLGTLLICKIFHCPLLFYINGIASEEFSLIGTPSFVISLINFVQKTYVKLAYKIFVVTEVLRNDIQIRHKVSRDKIEIIKNGVDTEIFKPIDIKESRRQLGFQENKFLIGFVGSLFAWHGVNYLIESAPLILKEVPNVKFIIVGKGRMEKILLGQVRESGLEGSFLFTGSVPFKQVPIYINAFDICTCFFKPVRTDPGDPIKLYEYLACSKPVVTSNVKGYGDFVEEVGAGLSVDASDPKAVAEAIIRLIKNEVLREEMGKKGRLAVEKGHTWQKRASEIERYLTLPT